MQTDASSLMRASSSLFSLHKENEEYTFHTCSQTYGINNVIMRCYTTIENVRKTIFQMFYAWYLTFRLKRALDPVFAGHFSYEPRFISSLEKLIRVRVSYVQHFNERAMTLDSCPKWQRKKRTCMIKRAEVFHQEMAHISCNFLLHIPTFRSTQTTSLSREKNTIYLARPKYRHVVKRRRITWSTILLPYYMLHGFSSTPNSILVQVNWATVDNPIVPGVRSSETAMSV